MGSYVSKPVTDKLSSDGENGIISYGASSMQGWRISQEDAHNSIIDFDKSTSFFAVYDGHGGHEVAEYTAQKLPEFVKECDFYKNGDLCQALTTSFLKFDTTLVTSEVLDILKEIAGTKDTASPEDDREEVDHLCREASMPLEDVIAKYSEPGKFQSPFRRNKVGCSSSSHAGSSSGHLKLVVDKFVLEDSDDEVETNENNSSPNSDSHTEHSESRSSNQVKPEETESCSTPSSGSKLCNGDSEHANNAPSDSSSEKLCDTLQNGNVNVKNSADICDGKEVSKDTSYIASDDIKKTSKIEDGALGKNVSESHNGETQSNLVEESPSAGSKGGKSISPGKGKKIPQRVITQKEVPTKPKRIAAAKAEEIYKQVQEGGILDSDSELDDSDEDADEMGDIEDDDDDEEVEENEDSDEMDEEEDSVDEDEEECVYAENQMSMIEEPAFDSGCTACVALLRGTELVVANVGDSRCVVCRNGEAIDMSIDHKPEDEPEASRITKAGGKVTEDGRVNGGLNLSRALGDHSYKQNKNLSPEEQMISPHPDVKTLTLEPKDRFMIIACDGIWNSMTSQEACDFVTKKLDNGDKLSSICEQLFDYCLAPNIDGDGAGCDNMTCIIISLDKMDRDTKSCTRTVAKESLKDGALNENATPPFALGMRESEEKLTVAKRPFAEVSAVDSAANEDSSCIEDPTCLEEKKIKLDTEAS